MVAKSSLVKKRSATLALLKSNAEKPVSGQMIALSLGVSRETIGKYVDYFRAHGYIIEASPRHGYCLRQCGELLIPEEIALHIKDKLPDFFYASLAISTNDIAMHDKSDNIIAVAESQSSGRGRRGGAWCSPDGGIWLSIGKATKVAVEYVGWLPLATAMETAWAIKKTCGILPQVKWPNDLIVDGKKLAGILIESMIEADILTRIVAGIGINANFRMRKFPALIRKNAVTLQDILGSSIDRGLCAAMTYQGCVSAIRRLEAGDNGYYHKRWTTLDALKNAGIQVSSDSGMVSGHAHGVDAAGRLKIATLSGTIAISSGHIEYRDSD